MSIKNDITNQINHEALNYEFSSIPYESSTRDRPPFMPGGNFPSGNFPGGFNGNSFPSSPGMPTSPPPNYIPSKKDNGVQKLSQNEEDFQSKSVSFNSIKFCLFKSTYIWETNGRSYWAFLFNVDRYSVSGFRWLGRNWVYFGLDLKRIDSFVCYRSTSSDDCQDCRNLKYECSSLKNNKQEYSLNETRDVYTSTLVSIDIPEVKEDFINQTIGYVENNKINTQVPCVKARTVSYRITLELSYPSNYNKDLKIQINDLANQANADIHKTLSSSRGNDFDSKPLETFNLSLALIPEALKTFSDSFNSNLKKLHLSKDYSDEITYYIREEKLNDNWKPYYYGNSFI